MPTAPAEGRELAVRLDSDHAALPGGLQRIGTCRACGLLIAQDEEHTWHHQPAIDEIDAAASWIERNTTMKEHS